MATATEGHVGEILVAENGRGGLHLSESIEKIAPALLAVQRDVQDPPREGENPHFGSAYVRLEDLIRAVRPVLSEHGISLHQAPGMDGRVVTVETMLLHESGEWARCTARSPMQRDDPQGVGSAITYLRRYSLASMLGLVHDADDDANRAVPKRGEREREDREHTCIDLDAKLGFGKHKALTWREVATEQPGYVKWLAGKDSDRLCGDCLEKLRAVYREAKEGGATSGDESGDEGPTFPPLEDLRSEIERTLAKWISDAGMRRRYLVAYARSRVELDDNPDGWDQMQARDALDDLTDRGMDALKDLEPAPASEAQTEAL